jgi:hypothetical protein
VACDAQIETRRLSADAHESTKMKLKHLYYCTLSIVQSLEKVHFTFHFIRLGQSKLFFAHLLALELSEAIK